MSNIVRKFQQKPILLLGGNPLMNKRLKSTLMVLVNQEGWQDQLLFPGSLWDGYMVESQ